MMASWLPAKFAGWRPPLVDLFPVKAESSSDAARRSSSWVSRYVPFVGLALFCWRRLSVRVSMALVEQRCHFDLFVQAVLLVSVGFILAMPLALGPILYLTRVVLLPILGVNGRLAYRYLQRQRQRTALTAGVLSVGVLAMTGMGNSLFSDLEDVRGWHQRISCGFSCRCYPWIRWTR